MNLKRRGPYERGPYICTAERRNDVNAEQEYGQGVSRVGICRIGFTCKTVRRKEMGNTKRRSVNSDTS